jgi:hypothetical protein
VPLGLPYGEDLLVRIKLQLKKDGTIMKSEILDHQRMNKTRTKILQGISRKRFKSN